MSTFNFFERGLRGTASDLLHKLRRDDPESKFTKFARKRWSKRKASGPLLLMHQNSWHASIVGYAFIGHIVAEHYGARPASFHFSRSKESPVAPLYDAIGAPTVLTPKAEEKHAEHARKLAGEIFSSLKKRRDIIDIAVDELSLGDIIYDSYQRYFLAPTAEIDDLRMLEVIERTLSVYFACKEFLDQNEVAAIFTDHAAYWSSAVMTRLAVRRGIAVFHVPYDPATIVRLDPGMFHGTPGNPQGIPVGYGSCKLTMPYHLFRKIFAEMPPEKQEAGIAQARTNLQSRLSGAFDPNVLPGGTAYHAAGGERLTATGDRPRILMMLHDFCDAPHAFRSHLFEDNYQWAAWMLEQASKTPFDWYAKPHPNSAHDPEMGAKNAEVIEGLKARFPKIKFLPPTVSNLQLVSEGITAMFTGYGTVGHEFAYMGIPVVNAADNPHINYSFNLHSRSVEELAGYVENAANLQVEINKRDIEAYAYMRYLAYLDRSLHPVSILPQSYIGSPEAQKKLGSPEGLKLAFIDPDGTDERLRAYFKDFFANKKHELPTA